MKLGDHLEKLLAFKVVVESGTLRSAAEKLRLTQPSLTRLVQTLEIATGEKLLNRGRNGVVVTQAGALVLEFSSQILRDLDTLEQQMKNPTDPLSGHLVVGSYETLVEYLWPDFLQSFSKSSPYLKISLRTSPSLCNDRSLEEGHIDIRVDAQPRVTGDFTSWVLYQDKFQLYCTPSLLGKFTHETPLIHCPGAFDRKKITALQHLENSGHYFKQTLELDSFTSIKAFCLKGVGVAVLPMRLAEASVKLKRLIPYHMHGMPTQGFGGHDISATIHSRRTGEAKVEFLLKSLRAWFKIH